MPSEFRNQKNLPEWLELDGHNRRRPLRRWRSLLAWGVLGVCVVGLVGAAVLPRSKRAIQAGPLSQAHGMFNDACERCHQDDFQTAKKLFGEVQVVKDEACTTCHDGPAHNRVATSPPACAGCHREHRGRPSLLHVPDGQCTACHADLKKHRLGGESGLIYADVRNFGKGDHPEFALHRDAGFADPGQMRFNHAKHLVAEGLQAEAGAKERRVLNCADCHKSDSAGRYMLPINYEKHCAECHPLTVQLAGSFKAENAAAQKQLDEAVAAFGKTPAPHREPELVRGALRERLLEFLERFPVVEGERSDRDSSLDLIVRRLSRSRNPSNVEWRLAREGVKGIEGRLFSTFQKEIAENVLFQGRCAYCHLEEGRKPSADAMTALPIYRKTALPDRWMKHARFSHERHRMVSCEECHKARDSSETRDVLMPKMESCQQCHNDRSGVRSDCAECHNYHDRNLRGMPFKGLTINECLGK